MEYFLGLDNRELDHDLVECAKCHRKQFEKPDRPGDKYAWECHGCGAVNENGKLHMFEHLPKAHFGYKGRGTSPI